MISPFVIGTPICRPGKQLFGWHGAGAAVALRHFTPEIEQSYADFLGFHAFGDSGPTKCFGQSDHPPFTMARSSRPVTMPRTKL